MSVKARCAGWPVGSYNVDEDSAETVRWFGVYKRVGVKKGCWGPH
jgi:hypothetical protein